MVRSQGPQIRWRFGDGDTRRNQRVDREFHRMADPVYQVKPQVSGRQMGYDLLSLGPSIQAGKRDCA